MRHTEQELLRVIDTLYEGMLDEEAWQRALTMITDFVSGSGAALYSLNPMTGQMFRSDLVRVDPLLLSQYQDTWILKDQRYVAGLSCAVGEPQVDEMLVSMPAFRRSAIYNEYLKPSDIVYILATWVERRPNRGVVLGVQGSLARGAFTDDERRRMAVLIPHVRRVVEMKDRMAQAQIRADGLLETMDRLPFGLLLLADSWEIIEASTAAQALLTRRAGIHADHGRLGFVHSADERAFAERLKEDPNRARLNDTILVSRPNSRQPLSLLVLPLNPSQEHWLRPIARWMVLVFDPDASPALPERVIQRTLGITAAEAALAQRITSGLSVAEAAAQLGVSLNTVRAQLKSIYAKTGVNTQAQLVRRVLTSPAVIDTNTRY